MPLPPSLHPSRPPPSVLSTPRRQGSENSLGSFDAGLEADDIITAEVLESGQPVKVGRAHNGEDGGDKNGGGRRRSSKKHSAPKGGGGRWTKEEDQKLRAAVAAVGPHNWKMIAQEFLGEQRSDVQCLHRWQKVLQPGLVKGPWTKEEDQIIIDCIEAGITKWSEIADRIPGRIGKQCRERWFNHLDPSLKKGGWTEDEDAILVEAQAKWGNSWTKIAKLLPGRSENAVKNRWNSATRRRAKAQTRGGAAEKGDGCDSFAPGVATGAAAMVGVAPTTDGMAASSLGDGAVPKMELALSAAQHAPPNTATSAVGLTTTQSALSAARPTLAKPEDGSFPRRASGLGAMAALSKTDEPARADRGARTAAEKKGGLAATRAEGGVVSRTSSAASAALASSMASSSLSTTATAVSTAVASAPGGKKPNGANFEKLFNDSSLTDREKELIHRAYLAGIATSGTGSSSSTARGANGTNGLHGSKLSDSAKLRMHMGAAAAGGRAKVKEETRDGVQWDFQSGGGGGRAGAAANPSAAAATDEARPAGDSSMPMDFLKEHGIDFDSMEVEPGVKRATAPPTNGATAAAEDGGEDDLELSSSLLTMSLDKDVSIDEMGISACEKNLLGRPLSSNVLDAIVLDDEQMKGLPKQNPSRSGSMLTLAPGATEARAADASGRAASSANGTPPGPGGGGSPGSRAVGGARATTSPGSVDLAKRGTAAAPAVAAATAAAAPAGNAAPRRQVQGRAPVPAAAPAAGAKPLPAATPANLLQASLIAQGFFSKQQNVNNVNTLTALQPGLLLSAAGASPGQRVGIASGAPAQAAHGGATATTAATAAGGGAAPTTQLRLSPTASMLTQLTAQYREGLISESTKSAMKHAVLRGTASRSPASAVAAGNLTLSLDSSKLQDAQAGVAATTAPGAQAAAVPPTTIAGGNVLLVRTSPAAGPKTKTSPTNGDAMLSPSQSLGEINGADLSDFVNSANLLSGSPSNTASATASASPIM